MSFTKLPIHLRAALFVAASLFFILGPAAQRSQAALPPLQRQEQKKPSAVRGRAIYSGRCASCHGDSGAGDGNMASQIQFPLPDLSDASVMRSRSPRLLFETISKGNMERLMPPWENALSEDERWDVTFYVLSLATASAVIEQGRETYRAQCADCHGPAGRGDGPQAATLSARPADLTDFDLLADKTQTDLLDAIGASHSLGDQLSEQEWWAVLDFVRTFSFNTIEAAAMAVGEGTIPVQIVNGTAGVGSSSLAGLEVTLHRFLGDATIGTVTGVSDSEGHVKFEGLPTEPDYRFGVVVQYGGIEYGSELASFPAGSLSLPLTISVFETTDSSKDIRALRTHLIFDYSGQGFRVAELYIIANEGDRTFVGSADGRTLQFSLPKGASGLTFDDDRLLDTVILTEDGFVDTMPVPPAGRQILMSYTLPSDGESYRFTRRIVYPTDKINVLVSDVGASVTSDYLVAQETISASAGQRYLHLAGESLEPGTEFVITFNKLPRTLPTSGPTATLAVPQQGLDLSTLRWIGALVAVVAVGFAALAYPFLQRYRVAGPAQAAEDLEGEREALIQAIADLDDRYDAGEIPEAEYRRQRARQKERLIQVARRIRPY